MARPKKPTTAASASKLVAVASNAVLSSAASTRSTRRTLEAVSIPAMESTFAKPAPKRKSPNDTSSLSSLHASTRGNSTDYETPETSAAATPITFPVANGKARVSGSLAITSMNKGKRKAVEIEDSEEEDEIMVNARMARDEELALKLQEAEYDEPNRKRVKTSKPSRKITVPNSDDENDSEMLDVGDSDDDDLPLSKRFSSKTRPGRPGGSLGQNSLATSSRSSHSNFKAGPSKLKGVAATPARPSRSASSSAQKAIATASTNLVLDSEESALSELEESEDGVFAVSHSSSGSSGDSNNESEDETAQPPVVVASSSRRRNRLIQNRIRRQRRTQVATSVLLGTMSNRAIRERKKLEKAHPQITTMWDELEKSEIIETKQAEQPESISRKLKSFQLEGLHWMTQQEKTKYRGGLLGDEMGMGKTIQAVSLIMSDYPARKPTLVVVPPVALMQWSNEIKDYTDGKLKVIVFHGQNSKVKGMSVKELKQHDVIMISYNSLESLYRKETKGWARGDDIIKEDSLIHAIEFHRLILDEAHSIKQRTTGVARACFALQGTYKWCLSGTPVQNRIGEFFSLLRFLEVRPFADYFYHRCEHCHHSQMEHVSVFNQEILNPITGSDSPDVRRAAMDKLHLITSRVMLRRMKRDHTASMELPPKEIVLHNEFFGEIERDFSTSIMTNSTRQFDTYVSRGVMLNNYANIFGLIMQMRQVANHPDLLLKKNAAEGQNVLVCNICDEPAEDAVRSKCHHDFCRACVKNYLRSCQSDGSGGSNGDDPDCPRCHVPLAIDLDQPELEQDEEQVRKSSIINRIRMENWTSSTKIEMLVYDLYKLRSRKHTQKSIVFSQFTSMLQLIEWRLRRAGFNTVMLDGSMTPIQRQRSIEYFMTNPDVEVFLVSLKAGGVALNLTEASRVFIVDPWWNPAAEWQSADRCHRIGQRRPCVITRLCIEDSVESRMVLLQEKKATLINGTINNDKVAMEKLTPEDMQFLFRGS
ncbi:MAG: DNA repair protein rad16 [Bathelium mastoideum]|nr:MAG: DNA repair protein rad16 [Bathelium mastoideum]